MRHSARWLAGLMVVILAGAAGAAKATPSEAAASGAEQAMRNVPRISIDEVKALMAKKQVILVDVRNPMEFGEGHLPGAINVPFDDIPKYVEAWKKDKRLIVTYCA